MAQSGELVLRDVHVPPAPAWWPLAPGWWIVIAVLLLAAAAWALWAWQRRRRLQAWQGLFDQACALNESNAQVAAMSELLRRAARRVDPQADKLQGEDWLRFLDGTARKDFVDGAGRLLLDGGFRRDVEPDQLALMKSLARARFFELMAGRR